MVMENDLESGVIVQSGDGQSDHSDLSIYNADQVYCQTLSYNDLLVDQMMFSGMKVCGTGLMVSLGVIICIHILRNAI